MSVAPALPAPSVKEVMDTEAVLGEAREALGEALGEAMGEEGRKVGREDGREEGREEGNRKRKNKRDHYGPKKRKLNLHNCSVRAVEASPR